MVGLSTKGCAELSIVAQRTPFADNSAVMSMSTIQVGSTWRSIETSADFPLGASLATQPPAFRGLAPLPPGLVNFRGRLVVPEEPCTIPDQDFVVQVRDEWILIEGKSNTVSPDILIELKLDGESKILNVESVRLRRSNSSVDSEILFTRIMLCLIRAQKCSLYSSNHGKLIDLRQSEGARWDDDSLLVRAKLSRKLKYLERVFRVTFQIPDEISALEVESIEIVFRGVTEGEFSVRSERGVFENLRLSPTDLRKPPFSSPGEFSRQLDPTVTIFNQRLDVGTRTVHLEKAEVADPRVIHQVQDDPKRPVDVCFELLDNQTRYRFHGYAAQSSRHRLKRLEKFKSELAKEEPPYLVDLLNEPLQEYVSSEEAAQIVVGWVQYNDLPDRYWPQEPEHDATAGKWRVPIYLVYANGKGGPVGEVVLDEKTGVIVSHTPVDELRSKGRALAEQILHA